MHDLEAEQAQQQVEADQDGGTHQAEFLGLQFGLWVEPEMVNPDERVSAARRA